MILVTTASRSTIAREGTAQGGQTAGTSVSGDVRSRR
jgi:hypothetical protein